jgi:hypothetical protein
VQAPQQITMFNGLYLADNNLSLLEHGARSVAWWALHNGGYGDTRGDLGLLSSGDCNTDNTICAPPANTPYPPYYAQQIVGAVARTGGRLAPSRRPMAWWSGTRSANRTAAWRSSCSTRTR